MSDELAPIEGELVPSRAVAIAAPPQLLDALRPADRVALLTEISNVVADVIAKQGWFKQIGPKKHILIQGWTFIGSLGGCSAKITGYEKIENGYHAHASVVRVDTGVEVGGADQVCLTTESKWKGKDDYALIGMASTRAQSRALSSVFRHVVELAGYSATPAEEMDAFERDSAPAAARQPEPPKAAARRTQQTPVQARMTPQQRTLTIRNMMIDKIRTMIRNFEIAAVTIEAYIMQVYAKHTIDELTDEQLKEFGQHLKENFDDGVERTPEAIVNEIPL